MPNSTNKIISHLWFDSQAEEAARFYASLFGNSAIGDITRYMDAGQEIHGREAGSVMTVEFELAGQKFIALNGGPHFTFTPAISFYVVCETESELDNLWEQFSNGGTALMELDKYAWSEKYGWVQDRYGLSWQLSLGNLDDVGQKITPSLMYISEEGRAEGAIERYTSIFDDSEVVGILRYGAGEDQPEGAVKHAQFHLAGDVFMAMDSSPEHADFTFNEAISLLVDCQDQKEIDYFWEKLSEGGDERAQQCGWLEDEFGVSWQVFPNTRMGEILRDADEAQSERVMSAMLQMKKIDIGELQAA